MSFPLANILQFKKRGSIEVSNDDVLQYFIDRATTSPMPHIDGSTEYLTGKHQIPDLGTYAGDVNDLTEQQITDLSNGLDYNGLGTNALWSTLEKVWVLENLDTTSTSGVKRYGFNFQNYDSGIANIQVPNSGSLGLPGTGDWVDSNSDGLGDDWSINNLLAATPTIVTGFGFANSAQKLTILQNSEAVVIISDLSPALNGSDYILSFRFYQPTILATLVSALAYVGNSSQIELISVDMLPYRETAGAVVVQSLPFTSDDTELEVTFGFSGVDNLGEQYFVGEVELIEV